LRCLRHFYLSRKLDWHRKWFLALMTRPTRPGLLVSAEDSTGL
jgi:hypothetical protein